MAGPIELSSKNGLMLGGTTYTLNVKNRFTWKRVTRDTKLAIFGHTKLVIFLRPSMFYKIFCSFYSLVNLESAKIQIKNGLVRNEKNLQWLSGRPSTDVSRNTASLSFD
jgi:hypothetical protein